MSAGAQSNNDALRSEATYWFNLKRSGDMTARDERIFLSWLDRAPAHRNAYEELERYWAILGSVAQDPEIMAALEQDGEFYDRPSWWPRLAVAAAALLLAVTAGWAAIDSGLLGLGIGAGQAEQQYAQTFETGVGERTLVTLPDGSHVTLDADSEMRVDDMRSKRAIALLRGRAFSASRRTAIAPSSFLPMARMCARSGPNLPSGSTRTRSWLPWSKARSGSMRSRHRADPATART